MSHPATMLAARMHEVGGALTVDRVDMPAPGPTDVLVKVYACGIAPNLGNVISNWTTWFPHMPLPPLPAVFGLDPAGEIVGVGNQVTHLSIGERVYVNPARYCGSCRQCRRSETLSCPNFAFQGYFGANQGAIRIFEAYPFGGMSQYLVAPASAIVVLPKTVTYEQGARFGYLGTVYSALRKTRAGAGDTVLINGITGHLGIGGALLGLALGIEKILGTGRNRDLLAEVKALAPDRIQVHCLDDGPVDAWARSLTGGDGVDGFVDCLGPGALHETFVQGLTSVRRGGVAVNVGAVAGPVPIDVHRLMDGNITFAGSGWFTTGEGEEMAGLARVGLLDLSVLEHVPHTLDQANVAAYAPRSPRGGFANPVVRPH